MDQEHARSGGRTVDNFLLSKPPREVGGCLHDNRPCHSGKPNQPGGQCAARLRWPAQIINLKVDLGLIPLSTVGRRIVYRHSVVHSSSFCAQLVAAATTCGEQWLQGYKMRWNSPCSKHKTFTRSWCGAGPASSTVDQYRINIESMPCISREGRKAG